MHENKKNKKMQLDPGAVVYQYLLGTAVLEGHHDPGSSEVSSGPGVSEVLDSIGGQDGPEG